MNIVDIRDYPGPNVYSYCPSTLLTLDIGPLNDCSTRQLGDFAERLVGLLPGLRRHRCSRGRPGGFLERLKEGTYMAHVVEHIAIELQNMAGMPVSFGKTRERRETPGVYDVVFARETPECGEKAVQCAVTLARALLRGQTPDVVSMVEGLKQTWRRTGLGPSSKCLVEAAQLRGIPVMRIGNGSLVQLGWGKNQKMVQATVTCNTSCISVDIACDKWLTKRMLADLALPVPAGEVVFSEDESVAAAERVGKPVTVKPLNANHGNGITLQLQDEAEIRTAFRLAQMFSEEVIVEKHIEGNDYRVLVVGGQVVAVARRVPAHIIGDGRHTIRQLIEKANQDPLRGEGHEKPLTKIKMDPSAILVLARQGLRLDSVPDEGRVVYLRQNGNLSTGGTAIDVTDQIHPANADIVVRAVQAIGLDIAGVDLVARDIAVPIDGDNGGIIEINAAPGIRMHHYPTAGKPSDVAGLIVNMLFPVGSESRIPLVAVTGTNGKTTTTRLIGHMMRLAGKRVGMTTTDGIFIGDRCVVPGDTTGPWSARVVLRDPTVEVAVLEVARGGILRAGLAYDVSDVAVVTNISEDHLGQYGVDDLEQLAWVKSLVVECVKQEGAAVLNADDPRVLQMRERCRSHVVLFSRSADNLELRRHLKAGGTAVFLRQDKLVLVRASRETALARLDDIPITLGGVAYHNVENVLAASAAACAAGLPVEIVRRGLESFGSEQLHNPGRFEVHDLGDLKVVVDYGHNPAGIRASLEAAGRMEAGPWHGVIGVPGDRPDDIIVAVGRVAGAKPSHVIIKEDADRRGRDPGEVADLLYEGCVEAGLSPDDISVVLDEGEAVQHALASAAPAGRVIVFYEKYDKVVRALEEFRRQQLGTDGRSEQAGQVLELTWA